MKNSWNSSADRGKVVALLMFKNEELAIPTFMGNILPFVDSVLGYDDHSTDCSVPKFLENGGTLIDFAPTAVWANGGENQIRQALLNEGRKLGGEYFIVLDCDESFSAGFSLSIVEYLKNLQAGQSLQLNWVNLWGSELAFCSGNSIWQPSYRDFIFRDHPALSYGSGGLHSFGRAPKATTDFGFLKVSENEGVVLHSQFINWEAVQIKQAWYRLQEWLYSTQSMYAINKKYKITLEKNVETLPLPNHWLPKFLFQSPENSNANHNDWRLREVLRIIDEHGIEKFKKLDIWTSNTISNKWRQHYSRDPRPSRWMGVREFAGYCLWYLKKTGKLK
jgi:hypothetical protein